MFDSEQSAFLENLSFSVKAYPATLAVTRFPVEHRSSTAEAVGRPYFERGSPNLDVRLIYASQASLPMSEVDLVALLITSRRNNERDDLSGLLMYCAQSFLQALEGPSARVDQTYARIARDPRHAGLRLLSRNVIRQRKYREWSMGFENLKPDRIMKSFPGYKPSTEYPLIDGDLIKDAETAELVLDRYQRNFATSPFRNKDHVSANP